MTASLRLVGTVAAISAAVGLVSSAQAASTWAILTLVLIGLAVVASYVILPTLADTLSDGRIRSTSISPLSARGVEWRSKAHATSILPTLRLERIRLAWGGLRDAETGVCVLRVDGVSLRVRGGDKTEAKGDATPRKVGQGLSSG
ncbi:Protein SABRE [Cryptotrichosporon argae]